MAHKMNELIGTLEQDNLIYDNVFPIDVKSIYLAAGKGLLKRGSVIAVQESTPDSPGVLWSSVSGEIADCILCEDIDTGNETTTGKVLAVAYRSGHFNRHSLIVAPSKTLTAAAEVELRFGGIYLSNAMS